MIETPVNAASSANASSAGAPCRRCARGRGNTWAAAHSAAPSPISAISTYVVRSSRRPPSATNAVPARTTAIAPTSAANGPRRGAPAPTAAAGGATRGSRAAGASGEPASEDTLADVRGDRRQRGDAEQDQRDEQRRRQVAVRRAGGEARRARHDRAVADLHGAAAARLGGGLERALLAGAAWRQRPARAASSASAAERAAGAAAELARAAPAERAREHVAAIGVLVDVGGEVVARVADLRGGVVAVELPVVEAVGDDVRAGARLRRRGGDEQRQHHDKQQPRHGARHASSTLPRRRRTAPGS